jgi:amidase
MGPETQLEAQANGLLEAFWCYEVALAESDARTLDAFFAAEREPVRTDAAGVLVGAPAISRMRAKQPPRPPRRLDRVHLRKLAEDAWIVIAEGVRTDGQVALQTQVWVSQDSGSWRIAAAHVGTGTAPLGEVAPGDSTDYNAWRERFELTGATSAPGELAGHLLAVKDMYAVAGYRIGAGNAAVLAAALPEPRDSSTVAILKGAGAVIAGIARTDELAFGLSGTNEHEGAVANPVVPGHLSGGSSSGPAAAVAAHQADIGLGTDTAGSIRVPASYCGLYGLRLTHGLLVDDGLRALAPSFDAVGLLARDPMTLARATRALTRSRESYGRPDTGRAENARRLLVLPALTQLLDVDSRAPFWAAAAAISVRHALPLITEEVVSAAELDEWFTAFRAIQMHEAWTVNRAVAEQPGGVSPTVRARLLAGADVDVEANRSIVKQAQERLEAVVDGGTLLLLPSTPGPAPRADSADAALEEIRARTLRLSCPASIGGLPALSIPAIKVGEHPMGLGVVAGRFAEEQLLRLIN